MIYIFITLAFTISCSQNIDNDNSPSEIYEEFWTWVDQNYIYFDLKEVDWEEVKIKNAALINENTTEDDLFQIMESSLLELRDGHNRLQRKGQSARNHNFKEGYEIHFDLDVIKQEYVVDSLGADGYLYWAMLEDEVGYVNLSDFNRYRAFRSVFEQMHARSVSKLIIDMRSNGGGDSNAVPELLSVLVKEKTALGAYTEKSGPEHNDVTTPIRIFSEPDPDFYFDIPVVVLIDRGSYSATSYFAAMIKGLDNVTLIGQVTGGGGGGNSGFQFSNGWLIAVSVSDFYDKNGVSIEAGVEPDIYIENTKEDIDNGVDKMLETAINY